MKTYYILRYRLDQDEASIVWYTNDTDGVVVNEQGYVPAFNNPIQLLSFVAAQGIALQPDDLAGLYDLDAVQHWLAAPGSRINEPTTLLRSWNLFLDVAASVTDQAYLATFVDAEAIYEKLSWEAMCASLAPPLHPQEPTLAPADIAVLREVLTAGLVCFRGAVQPGA